MTALNETISYLSEDEVIAEYEREFTRSTAERDAEIARVALEKALYAEYGEIRGGVKVILGDQ